MCWSSRVCILAARRPLADCPAESWENKGKFPPSLKPALAKLAILAIRLDEYDDDFFSLMPMIFPYNKFTMSVRLIFIPFAPICVPASFPTTYSEIYTPGTLTSCPQKLIKRTVFTDHLTLLTERQDVLLTQLATLAKDGFEKAKEEWERSVVAWGASCAYTHLVHR